MSRENNKANNLSLNAVAHNVFNSILKLNFHYQEIFNIFLKTISKSSAADLLYEENGYGGETVLSGTRVLVIIFDLGYVL